MFELIARQKSFDRSVFEWLSHINPNSRSLKRWLLFIYLFVSLRHWSSFFFVAGWQTFGISLAWVEHLRALFQFWSDNILHCHLDWGKLKQPFLLYKVLVESFSTNLTWFLFPTVFRVFNHWHDCMVAVGLGLEWGTIVRPECLTYDLQ